MDLFVLSTGIAPSEDTKKFAELLDMETDKHGFLLSDHKTMHTNQSATAGVYLAGCNLGPGTASTAFVQARASAADILSSLIPGQELEMEMMVSSIDKDISK